MALVLDRVPPATKAELREALQLAGNQMLSYGITSFTDAGAFDPSYIVNMSELSAESRLKQRVRACLRWTPLAGDDPDARGETLIAERAHLEQPRLLTDCVKIVLDGVPTESRTAVMLEPYIWFPTPISEHDISQVIGEERMERWIPIKDAVDTNGRVVAGSDWPVVPSVNPWLAIETMVTRRAPGGGDKKLGGSQTTAADTLNRHRSCAS